MAKKVCAVLLAAGSSTRMGFNKMLIDFDGKNPIELCMDAYAEAADEFVIAVSKDTESTARLACKNAAVPVRIVRGGERRQDSVLNAISMSDADIVSIHDCARCLVSREIIKSSVQTATEHGCGIASVKVYDTVRNALSGEIVDRDALLAAQTPQSFHRSALLDAYAWNTENLTFTDDAALFKAAGNELFFSFGARSNMKLTAPEDVELFRALLEKRDEGKVMREQPEQKIFRVGFGEDTHRLVSGRKLILGGVEVPFEMGLDGHSDADVLTHALIDALLGACALGDIGQHFPDNKAEFKDINSLILAKRAADSVREHGFSIVNLDATLIAQRPKLAAFRDGMRDKLAEAFGLPMGCVSVKFTTPEHTGPEGRGESMTARATAFVIKTE